jgi:hypothetical protein
MSAERQNRSSWVGIAILAGLFILYVLSIGPVGAASQKDQLNGSTIKVLRYVYSPLTWLHEHTILEKPLDAYTSLWGFKLLREGLEIL